MADAAAIAPASPPPTPNGVDFIMAQTTLVPKITLMAKNLQKDNRRLPPDAADKRTASDGRRLQGSRKRLSFCAVWAKALRLASILAK